VGRLGAADESASMCLISRIFLGRSCTRAGRLVLAGLGPPYPLVDDGGGGRGGIGGGGLTPDRARLSSGGRGSQRVPVAGLVSLRQTRVKVRGLVIPPEADLSQGLNERSGERAHLGAPDLEATSPSEGHRRLWDVSVRRQDAGQGEARGFRSGRERQEARGGLGFLERPT
jgi:hypothetical protein